MMTKKFQKSDSGFICHNCLKKVEPLGYTSRDHCPYCLHSIHIDIMPGDRQNTCLGDLVPIDIEKYKNTYKIIYKCLKCGQIHKNIMATDDNFDLMIKIMQDK